MNRYYTRSLYIPTEDEASRRAPELDGSQRIVQLIHPVPSVTADRLREGSSWLVLIEESMNSAEKA
jgi:hypothetical protein